MRKLLVFLALLCQAAFAGDYTVTYGVQGLFAEINKAIVTRMYEGTGIQPVFVEEPSARIMMSANQGKADAALFRIQGAEKQFTNLIPVPESHYAVSIHAFSTKQVSVTNWSDLSGYTIAYINGFLVAERNTKGIESIKTKTVEQALKLLANGRVDFVVAAREAGLEWIHSQNSTSVSIVENPLELVPVYHYVHQQHQNLIPLLTKNLLETKQSGELTDIVHRLTAIP